MLENSSSKDANLSIEVLTSAVCPIWKSIRTSTIFLIEDSEFDSWMHGTGSGTNTRPPTKVKTLKVHNSKFGLNWPSIRGFVHPPTVFRDIRVSDQFEILDSEISGFGSSSRPCINFTIPAACLSGHTDAYDISMSKPNRQCIRPEV